jgi:hypothetical protein
MVWMTDPRTIIPPLRFAPDDATRAFDEWGCNCGPTALAAVLGLTLDEVRPCMGDFEAKHYTNPSLMLASLDRAILHQGVRRPWRSRSIADNVPKLDWPSFGLARIQWEGPWTEPGVPLRVRYRHTHWVGACAANPANVGVFDVNALSDICPHGWTGLDAWEAILVPHIIKTCVPRANGRWHITHTIEIGGATS